MCFSKISLFAFYVFAAMSEDERVRSIRGGHRGVVTKVVKEVDDLLSTEEPLDAERVS